MIGPERLRLRLRGARGIGRHMAPAPRRGGRPLAALAAATCLGLWTTAPAQAAPFVDVTYDLGGSTAVSTVPDIGLSATIPPDGTISGKQTIRYTGDSGAGLGLATGPVELLTFNLYVHATLGNYGYTTGGNPGFVTANTSDLHFEFLGLTTGAPQGQLLSGGTITPLGAAGVFRVTGSLHCFTACLILGVAKTVTYPMDPRTFTAPLPVLTGASVTPQILYGTAVGIEFNAQPDVPGAVGLPVTGTTFLVGREIARTPEPSTLPLLAGGLAGLGLTAAAWRRLRA